MPHARTVPGAAAGSQDPWVRFAIVSVVLALATAPLALAGCVSSAGAGGMRDGAAASGEDKARAAISGAPADSSDTIGEVVPTRAKPAVSFPPEP